MTQRTPSRALHVPPIVVRALEICNGQETHDLAFLTMPRWRDGCYLCENKRQSARYKLAQLVLNRIKGAPQRVSFAA